MNLFMLKEFIKEYNSHVPYMKQLSLSKIYKSKNLENILEKIIKIISDNNFSPTIYVKVAFQFFDKKINIFSFLDNKLIRLYKNNSLYMEDSISEYMNIIENVKKSKKNLDKMKQNVLFISKEDKFYFLKSIGRIDSFFLLANGFRKDIPEKDVKLWDSSKNLRKKVLEALDNN